MKLWKYIPLLLLLCNVGYSQYCGTTTSNVSITPTTASQLTTSYSSGRRAFNFVATAGCIYEFSTCSQTTGDTYLRLYSTGTGGTLLAQNDNFCGTQSTLTWTATVNGTVSILLTRASCNALQVATRMSYRLIGCRVPPCTNPISPTNNLINANINQTLSWNAISTATSYDVYFGTNPSPPLVATQVTTTYNPGTLNYSTTYYWKIIPRNLNGTETSCSTWSFTTKEPGCLTAQYGQFPSTTYNPGCSGTTENITTVGYASEYSSVTLISNVTYTLSSSNSADFITISDDAGTTVLAYGTGSVVYNCTTDGDYRFYTHTNELCGASTISRSRRIQCSTPPPPINDVAANAIDMGSCSGVVNGNTKFATNVGDGPSCYTASGETWTAPGVWYKVKGNGQNINLSLCGSAYDTKIFVYTGTPSNLTCLTYNDDFCSLQSQVNFTSTNDSIYHILVTGYSSSKGAFTLSVTITASPPIINTQPQGNTICLGQSHTFSVTSTGNQGPLSYQWYLNNTIISGATSPTYSTNVAGNYYVKVTNSCGDNTQSNSVTLTVLNPPSLSTSISNISCSGGGNGSIDLVVSGPGSPFTFNWSGPNGFTSTSEDLTNLATGIYTVVVANFIGCTSTTTIPVSEPSSLVLTLIGSDALCVSQSSGSIDLTVSGGTPNYSYLWSTGSNTEDLFNLPAGTYSINVTDNNNCIATASVTISDPLPFTLTVNNPTITTCQTNSIQLIANVNQSTNSYLWSTGSTTNTTFVLPTTTTVYTVQAWSQNNCYAIAESTVTVTQSLSLPTIGSVTGPTQAYPYMVSGNIATYSVSPVVGATNYQWYIPNHGVFFVTNSDSNVINVQINQNFAVNSNGGDFYVKVTNGCDTKYSDTLHVDILQNPKIIGSDCGTPLGNLKTYRISNSLPGLTYQWIPPYGATIVSGQGNDTIVMKCSIYFQSNTNLTSNIPTIYGTFTGTKSIFKNPNTPTMINGLNSVCADNNTIYEYYVDSVPTASYYIWNLPNGCSIIDGIGNDTIHVVFNTTFVGGNLSCMSANQCGSSAMRYFSIQNSGQLYNPGTISGPGDLCPYLGTTTVYSVTPITGASFTWIVPNGMTLVSGQGTNLITVQVSNTFTSGIISVKLNQGCGDSPQSTRTLSTTQGSITVSAISGLSNVCSYVGTNQTVSYSISSISGVNYNWSVPANVVIVSGQGSNIVNVRFLNGFNGGNISVTVSGGCTSPTTKSISIIISYPSMIMSGNSCIENGVSYNYSINLSNMSSYNIQYWNWVVPGNAIITQGQGTPNITVLFPSNFESNCINNLCDSIKCYVQFPCGIKLVKKIIGMTTYPVSSIAGPTTTCGPDTIQLSVPSIPNRATNFIWGKPNGTQFISINGVPQFPSQGASVYSQINTTFLGGSYNVQSVNQCGSTSMYYFYVNKSCTTNLKLNNSENDSYQQITTIDDLLSDPEYLESLKKPFSFIVYPNPAKNKLNLRVFRGTYAYYLVTIYNTIGSAVYTALKETEDSIDISNLPAGVYTIKITDNETNEQFQRVVFE